MDSSVHTDTPSSTSSRKRARENETPSQKLKREKAAERQRRKRERDRNNAGMGIMAFASPQDLQQQQQQQHHQPQPQQQQHPQPVQQPATQSQNDFQTQELTPEEAARRDRVRAAARERQRKHRLLVKQRKMRDLGLDMGNEIISGMEEVHYRVGADGNYQPVPIHELQQHPPPHPHMGAPHEPPFVQGSPGQTFASTLLLSFSCAPLLKSHLLRSLNMTNEELTSLEPIIAEAWDRWDHQRRMYHAEQAAKGGPPGPPMGAPYPVEISHDPHGNANGPQPYPPPNGPGPTDPQHPNDFRARFHRSLLAPMPFRTYEADPQASASTTTPTSASGSGHGPPSDSIDPHLAAASANGNSASAGLSKS